jgi:anti-sigma factor RsiW
MSEHVSDGQLSLLIDGELSLAAREAVIAHVRACPVCAARHDTLIELAAPLRLQPALQWSPDQTEATLRRVRTRPGLRARVSAGERDWTLAFAGLLAAAGVIAAVVLAPLASGGSLGVLSALLPGGLFGGSRQLLVALTAVAVLGLAALPLSRSR